MRKIVITGGHLTPALAIISELSKKTNWEIFYFGRKTSMEGDSTPSAESKIIPEMGIKFITINTGRLQRRFTTYTIPSLLRIPWGFLQSFFWLIRIKPNIICSFGGYVSVPIVFASWLLRIPVLTHEQTVVYGLASKINSLFAKKICVSFNNSLEHFPKGKVVLTGNPIRSEIFKKQKPKWIGLVNKPIIYITGGSQGSVVINEIIYQIAPVLLSKYIIIHQVGEKNFEEALVFQNTLPLPLQENYHILPFIDNNSIGWVMSESKLIISRAGANTISEIASLGKIAILIPLPFSFQNEQLKNAEILKDIGVAQIIEQNNLTPEKIMEEIEKMMRSYGSYKDNSEKAKNLIPNDAAQKIVDEIEKML